MLKVLVAPLDWGLGHATRCIPIIKELTNQGCTVIIAADRCTKSDTPGRISWFLLCRIARIPPEIRQKSCLYAAKNNLHHSENLDRVSSGKMLGCAGLRAMKGLIWSSRTTVMGCICRVSSRSLSLISCRSGAPFGAVADWLLHTGQLCLYPPLFGLLGAGCGRARKPAGKLSHPTECRHTRTVYRVVIAVGAGSQAPRKRFDLLILLSGPEPQRTILERVAHGAAGQVAGQNGPGQGAAQPAIR